MNLARFMMLKLKELLKEHRIAIILAILTSMIVALPQVYFRYDHRNDDVYQGIELLPDSHWSPRVREVQDGHPNFGSIYYKDGKDDPYLFQPVGSMTVAYMGQLLSLDYNNTILLSRLVLPFFTFILIYIFAFLLTRDRLSALSSTSVILLASAFVTPNAFRNISNLLDGVSPTNFLDLAAPVNPAMIFIPFFGFLISFWLYYQKRDWRWGVVSALVLGLNFYNYFYTWTFLYAFGGLLGLLLLLQKKLQETIRIAWVFIGALLLAIPYAFNLYRASQFATYEDLSLRHGVVLSHAPLFIGLVATIAILVFFIGFPKENRERYFFSLALILTPFITLNQQILTGKILQPAHYHWYFHKPIAVVIVLSVLFYFFSQRNWHSYRKILAIGIITTSFALGVSVQGNAYFTGSSGRDGGYQAVERQKYGPVMNWLNNNAEKEAVVFGNRETSIITVIYSSLNVFHHVSAQLALSATEERLLNSLFSYYRLQNVGAKNVRDVFNKDRTILSTDVYGIYYRENFGSYGAIPDEKFNEIVALYENSLLTQTPKWLYDIWKKYEVEYLVWDTKADPEWQLQRYPFLEEVVKFGDITIYRFHLEVPVSEKSL